MGCTGGRFLRSQPEQQTKEGEADGEESEEDLEKGSQETDDDEVTCPTSSFARSASAPAGALLFLESGCLPPPFG
jgi:hypothetical protein